MTTPLDDETLAIMKRLWREHDGSCALGAFTGVRVNDLMEWHRKGMLHFVTDSAGPVAACVMHKVKRLALVDDFRNTPVVLMRPGDVVVSRMMMRERCDAQLFDLVSSLTAGHKSFVHAWQEHETERQLVERLGLELHCVKIKSTAELIGIYGPAPAMDEYDALDVAGIAPLDFTYDARGLRNELSDMVLAWTVHYSYYNVRDSWTALALRGYGDPYYIIKPSEMTREWKTQHPDDMRRTVADTALYERFPSVRSLVDRLPAETQRVRLMQLAPGGGELQRHTDLSDSECGTADRQVMRLHFPIVTNQRVLFESWRLDGSRQQVHMDEGCGWYLDVRKPHTARNDGSRDRVHLVVDVYANSDIRKMVQV